MRNIVLSALMAVGFLSLTAGPAAHKHIVKKGETLYSICKEYDLKLNELLKVNPTVAKSKTIKPGEQLLIPYGKNAVAMSTPANHAGKAAVIKPAPVPSTPGLQYRDEDEPVKTKQQPEAITSVANEAPVVEPHAVTTPAAFSLKAGGSNTSDYANLFSQYSAHGFSIIRSRGEANYLAENTSGNPHLALYNDAEVGSIVQVINLMNKKTLYVKVIGRLSSLDLSHEIVLKLSRQAAAEMGASDDKFLVEVSGVKQ